MLTGQGESTNNPGVSSPANFLLQEVSIMRENLGGQELGNQKLNITPLISNISISESIYKNAINVNIRVIDNRKLYSTMRLNGSEKIKLRVSRNNQEFSDGFNLDLVVADVHLFTEVNSDIQSYVLRCVPEYSLINQTKTISDSFLDISEAIKSICHGHLNIPDKNLDIPLKKDPGILQDKTRGSFGALISEFQNTTIPSQSAKGIYPLMKPLSVINWLVRNISDNSTPYYFYQTSNGIVSLNSYQNMLEAKTINDDKVYSNIDQHGIFTSGETMINTEEDNFEKEKFTILKLNQPANLSTIKNISNGSYASNKFSVDIYKKEYKSNDEFEYDGMKILNSDKPFSDNVKFGEKKLLENKTSKNYFINLNSGAFDNSEANYHDIVNDTIQKKEAYHNILDSQIQEIVINGDFQMRSGEKINLEILQNKSGDKKFEGEELDTPDAMLSGTYLITALEHTFENQKYLTRLRIKRDSYPVDMNKPDEVFQDNKFTVET